MEQNNGCFSHVQSEPVPSAARHPDDSQEIFPEEIYSEEEYACRVAIDSPEFLDTTEYYDEETGYIQDPAVSVGHTEYAGEEGSIPAASLIESHMDKSPPSLLHTDIGGSTEGSVTS